MDQFAHASPAGEFVEGDERHRVYFTSWEENKAWIIASGARQAGTGIKMGVWTTYIFSLRLCLFVFAFFLLEISTVYLSFFSNERMKNRIIVSTVR